MPSKHVKRVCRRCNKNFFSRADQVKKGWGNYCSHSCANKSRVVSLETKKKMSDSSLGSRNANWKGDKAGYGAIHEWVKRRKGFRPPLCIKCGTKGKKVGTKKRKRWNIEWANISGEYKRDVDDFMPLCRSCHTRYDGIIPVCSVCKQRYSSDVMVLRKLLAKLQN